jgi:hypothetical protein
MDHRLAILVLACMLGISLLTLAGCNRRQAAEPSAQRAVQLAPAPEAESDSSSPMDMPDWYRQILRGEVPEGATLADEPLPEAERTEALTVVRGYW